MSDLESRIRDEFDLLDPLPPGSSGDWHDVLGRTERPRHRRHWLLAAGTVAAVAVAAIALLALLPAGGGGPSNAAAALNRLANLVVAHSQTPKPGQYLFVGSQAESAAFLESRIGACEISFPERRETWIGTDGSGLIRETSGPGRYTSQADRALCRRQVLKYGHGAARDQRFELARRSSSDWFAPRCLSLKPIDDLDWSSLSSDPQVLLQQITQHLGRHTPAEEFSDIGTFLRETDAPPTVRATLLRAIALIPGVKLLGTVRDHVGRPGIGFSYPSEGEYIFDATTGELLGERGTIQAWTVYLRQTVVVSLPDKPPAPLGPPCTNGGGFGHVVRGGSITNGAPLKSP